MEIAFRTKLLRSICEYEHVAHSHLCSTLVTILKARVADLRAADTVSDLLVGHPTAHRAGSEQYFSITLDKADKLCFQSNHKKSPLLANGAIDWPRVYRIKIVSISGNS